MAETAWNGRGLSIGCVRVRQKTCEIFDRCRALEILVRTQKFLSKRFKTVRGSVLNARRTHRRSQSSLYPDVRCRLSRFDSVRARVPWRLRMEPHSDTTRREHARHATRH